MTSFSFQKHTSSLLRTSHFLLVLSIEQLCHGFLFPVSCFLIPEKKVYIFDQQGMPCFWRTVTLNSGGSGYFCVMVTPSFCHCCLPWWHPWSPGEKGPRICVLTERTHVWHNGTKLC